MRKLLLLTALLTIFTFSKAEAVTYLDGASPLLSSSPPGTFDFGIFHDDYIGPTVQEGNGTALDGTRVYFYDITSPDDPTADPFNLLVWSFSSVKDSLRLYTHQDHLSQDGLADTDFEAQDVMEYSVFGCNGGVGACTTKAEWTFLSDVLGFSAVASGKPTYTFGGTAPTTIYRGGSAEFGLINAYTRDYTFPAAYNYYGMRASTVGMIANDADPELDAVVAFNRVDFPVDQDGNPAIPEPSSMFLVTSGLLGLVGLSRRKK